MKLYQDYKKQFKFLVIGLLLIVPIVFSSAQTIQELNQKIDQKNADIEKLEKEIKQYQSQLNELGKQKSSLSNSIKELDLTRKKLIADMAVTQNKIDKTNFRITELSSQIGDKEKTIASDIEAIKIEIRNTNEIEITSMVEILLSDNNFTDMWNDVDNMMTIQNRIREKITELKLIKSDLEDTRKETIDAKNELVQLKNQLNDQKKIVDQNTIAKKKLLTQTKNNETNYQKLLKANIAKKEIFEKELEEYESQLKYILDPSKLPGKGSLSWPLDSVYVTSPFGQTKTRYHKGIDLRASVGTSVKSMADGIIAGTGDTDIQCPGVSYGRFILIKYNNGLASTYGHLSLIKVKKGDTIKRGQIIGYSGNTGSSTGPHLHVSVYPKDAVDLKTLPSKSCPGHVLTQPIAPLNAYINPMNYLPSL